MKRRMALAVCLALGLSGVAAARFAPPTGVYSLGRGRDLTGTAVDDRIVNIRDYDFVSGFTLRLWWRDVEPTPGVYDFGVIDEAFRLVGPLGQRISLEVLDEPPDYVVSGAGATYTDHRGGTRPVPWDAFGQSRRAALQNALASHPVDDGLGLTLAGHPTLAAVNADPMGLNFGVRDLNGGLVSHPDYTRQRYVDAVVDGVAAGRAAFPLHEGSVGFFSFDDESSGGNGPGERVDKQLLERLDALYNGPGQPTLSLFVENLSDNGPRPQPNGIGTGGNLLEWTERGGGTMIQALDAWTTPPPERAELLASGSPATGIALAFNDYGTRFFELYINDLDNAHEGALDAAGNALADDLRAWNTLLASPAPLAGDFNLDGFVDARDYGVWRDAEGASVRPYTSADGNGDGVVDALDYDVWALGHSQALGDGSPLPLSGDHNRDGAVDALDYTVWRDAEGASVAPFTGADGNGDGVVDAVDLQTWRDGYGRSLPGASPPPLPGDYNGDGIVDPLDYTSWRDTEGTAVTRYTGADGNGDGVVEVLDYGLWRANYGRSPASPSTIPEPSAAAPYLALLVFAAGRRAAAY